MVIDVGKAMVELKTDIIEVDKYLVGEKVAVEVFSDIEMPGYGEQDIVLYKLIKSDEFKDLKDLKDKADLESAKRVAREYLKF